MMVPEGCVGLGVGKRVFSAYGPLFFILLYLVFTYLVFIYGPLSWTLAQKSYFLLSLLVLGCMATLALGYYLNIRKSRGLVCKSVTESDGFPRLGKVLTTLFAVSAFFNILTVWAKLLLMYNPALSLWQCILNPGLGYMQGQGLQNLYEAGQIPDSIAKFSLLFKALTLFSGLTALYYPLGWLSWRKLRIWMRLLFTASLMSTLLYYWILGTQMGFGMRVFTALPVLLLRAACVRHEKASKRPGAGKRLAKWFRAYWGVLTQILCLLLAFVLLFGGMQIARAGAKHGGNASFGDFLKDQSLYSFRYGGKSGNNFASYAAMMLSFYLGHGYAGLGKALDLPLQWTYGLNWSNGLLQISEKYLGVTGVWERSYLFRNELVNGWPALNYWSTLYAWLASDVTFWGVPIVMLLLGVFFAAVWKDLAIRRNAMAAVVLGQLFQLFIMIPANNQLFNTISAFFSSLLVLALYLFSRTRLYREWNKLGVRRAGEEANP
jgi:hypothetical protein